MKKINWSNSRICEYFHFFIVNYLLFIFCLVYNNKMISFAYIYIIIDKNYYNPKINY